MGSGDISPGCLVVDVRDPLAMGQLLVLAPVGDGRWLCEQVHYEVESENDPAPRGLFRREHLELYDTFVSAA